MKAIMYIVMTILLVAPALGLEFALEEYNTKVFAENGKEVRFELISIDNSDLHAVLRVDGELLRLHAGENATVGPVSVSVLQLVESVETETPGGDVGYFDVRVETFVPEFSLMGIVGLFAILGYVLFRRG
ncbi:hypothetical protein H6504_01300 [Candidatus Woesearchaeota archaeon]|nr:hypothetical protein [Candidatus Woesearchaeota archaeon]